MRTKKPADLFIIFTVIWNKYNKLDGLSAENQLRRCKKMETPPGMAAFRLLLLITKKILKSLIDQRRHSLPA